jgi:hypothetical protein
MDLITAQRAYALGWFFFFVAVFERILINRESMLILAASHSIMPHNFLDLSFLFFVIAIATRTCYPPARD